MQSLTEYMKKELVFYIKQEYDKGIPLSQIRKALLEGGHHTNLVKEAVTSLRKHKFNLVKALNEPVKSSLDKELYFNIVNSLVKYVEYQLAAGKTPAEVKKILADYGHSKDVIEKALTRVNKTVPTAKKTVKILDICAIVGTLLLVFIIAGATEEPLEIVAFGFFPSILTIIAANFAVESRIAKRYIWLFPVFFILLFIFIGARELVAYRLEYFKLAFLNLTISLGYTYIKLLRKKDVDAVLDTLEEELMSESDDEADATSSKSNKGPENKSKKTNHKKKN